MSANAARFGQIVRARRLALGDLTQIDVWNRGGPSNSTLTAIENGEWKPNSATFRKLDAGLDWTPGSARRAWDGGEPAPAEPRPEAAARRRTAVEASDAEIVAEVARRMSTTREERDRGRDTPATNRAGVSPAFDLDALRDAVLAAFGQYVHEADRARKAPRGSDTERQARLDEIREDYVTRITAAFARARPDSSGKAV